MNREEKILMAIDKGWYCDFTTGEVYNPDGLSRGGNPKTGYKSFGIYHNKKSNTIHNHIFIWYCKYGIIDGYIDHINMDKMDNSINNLRCITKQQNHFNTKAKGYFFRKDTKKWMARIMINYKAINLGCFPTEKEARQSYLEAKKIYHII